MEYKVQNTTNKRIKVEELVSLKLFHFELLLML